MNLYEFVLTISNKNFNKISNFDLANFILRITIGVRNLHFNNLVH